MTKSVDLDWQSGKKLTESNKYMLETGLLSDITFIVGPERWPVKAHKYILASRSSVFCTMMTNTAFESPDQIELPDIPKDIFNLFLRYLYCDENIRIDLNNVLGLLYVSEKYNVKILADRCSQKLNKSLNPVNVCTVIESAHRYGDKDLKEQAFTMILRNPKAVFAEDNFGEMCPQCFSELLSKNVLPLTEPEVFEVVVAYSEKKCKQRGLPVTPENRRLVLEGAEKQVRYPVMDKNYFMDKVEPSGLLSEEDVIKLYRHLTRPERHFFDFDTNPRTPEWIVNRFDALQSGWGYRRDNVDAITFSVSQDIDISGFEVYGGNQGTCQYHVDMSLIIYRENSEDECESDILACEEYNYKTKAGQKTYELPLEYSKSVEAGKKYSVTMTINGPTSYYGIGGVETVEKEGVRFKFETSPVSTNPTNVTTGQICGIMFMKKPV